MGSLRRSLIFSAASFLLQRAWGRKLMWKTGKLAAEHEMERLEQPETQAMLARRGVLLLMEPVYFVVGAADAWLHGTAAGRRREGRPAA